MNEPRIQQPDRAMFHARFLWQGEELVVVQIRHVHFRYHSNANRVSLQNAQHSRNWLKEVKNEEHHRNHFAIYALLCPYNVLPIDSIHIHQCHFKDLGMRMRLRQVRNMWKWEINHIDGFVQDDGNSNVLAMVFPQSFTHLSHRYVLQKKGWWLSEKRKAKHQLAQISVLLYRLREIARWQSTQVYVTCYLGRREGFTTSQRLPGISPAQQHCQLWRGSVWDVLITCAVSSVFDMGHSKV